MNEQVPSKKCVLEAFLKYDGFPQKWALRIVRDDGSTFELLESSKPIEFRHAGDEWKTEATTPEPPAEPTPEEVCEYAYRLKMWRRGDGWLPIQLAEIMRKQIETAWSLRAAQPPCPGCAEFVRMQHDVASALGVDAETDSIDLHQRIYSAVSPSLPAGVSPLAVYAYAMTERHLSGYRLILGFDTLTKVQAAHKEVADLATLAQSALTKPVGCVKCGSVPLATERGRCEECGAYQSSEGEPDDAR